MQLRTALLCSTTLSLMSAAVAQTVATTPVSRTEASLPSQGELRFTVGGALVRRFVDAGVTRAAISHDAGSSWQPLLEPDDRLHFVLAQFDPLVGEPPLAGVMAAPPGTRLFIVQLQTQVLGEYRAALTKAGAQIVNYLPANGLTVRCDARVAASLQELKFVRWVGALQNGFKLDAQLTAFAASEAPAMTCNLVLATKADRLVLAGQIAGIGGTVTNLCDGSIMIQASLTPAQLVSVMSFDTMVWADPTTEVGYDLDNARIQGGANYVETQGNYRGQGVRAEITEAMEETHPDFIGRVLVRGANSSGAHGHCTAGCVGGNGSGNFAARGIMPECALIEGAYSAGSHYAQIVGSTNPALAWKAMVTTASWGSAVTSSYTAISQTVDDALFDSDLTRLNSQSNQNSTLSRPEAWAKNIISGGGVAHFNDSNPGNDVHTSASYGPAADGRQKPDACCYYDNVLTSDLSGTAGYNTAAGVAGNYTTGFNGTSSATPIIAGHVGIIHQMFTDGLFGNVLPLPATQANRFANKPHMSTSKAVLCSTATPYLITQVPRRVQGWGFPALNHLYDERNKILVVDEYDTLQLNQSRTYFVWVSPGSPEFRATLVYTEPQGNAAVIPQLVNNANLKVTRFSDGVFWWGNNGLSTANVSTSGGAPGAIDNVECVYLTAPTAGIYLVRVEATSIVVDAKVETPQLDLDYALVAHPLGGGYRNNTGMTLDLSSTGPGNLTIAAANVPAAGWTEGYTALTFNTTRGLGFGKFFGLEDDSLTVTLWSTAAAPGNAFHFTNAGAGTFPFTNFVFPNPAIISFLAGLKIDGVCTLFNASGNIVAQSNVDRLTLQ